MLFVVIETTKKLLMELLMNVFGNKKIQTNLFGATFLDKCLERLLVVEMAWASKAERNAVINNFPAIALAAQVLSKNSSERSR
jgi:hypothetical protein